MLFCYLIMIATIQTKLSNRLLHLGYELYLSIDSVIYFDLGYISI